MLETQLQSNNHLQVMQRIYSYSMCVHLSLRVRVIQCVFIRFSSPPYLVFTEPAVYDTAVWRNTIFAPNMCGNFIRSFSLAGMGSGYPETTFRCFHSILLTMATKSHVLIYFVFQENSKRTFLACGVGGGGGGGDGGGNKDGRCCRWQWWQRWR